MQNWSIKRRWIIVAFALFASVATVASSLGMHVARADNGAGVDYDHSGASIHDSTSIHSLPTRLGFHSTAAVRPRCSATSR